MKKKVKFNLKKEKQQKLYKIEDEAKKKLIASKDGFLNSTNFQFLKIFDEDSTQEEVFLNICTPLIDDMFNFKKSGLIFAYGITNAGKTHTIIGNKFI